MKKKVWQQVIDDVRKQVSALGSIVVYLKKKLHFAAFFFSINDVLRQKRC